MHECVALIEIARVVQSAFHDCSRFIYKHLLVAAAAVALHIIQSSV